MAEALPDGRIKEGVMEYLNWFDERMSGFLTRWNEWMSEYFAHVRKIALGRD
jgi:hypothetical protein